MGELVLLTGGILPLILANVLFHRRRASHGRSRQEQAGRDPDGVTRPLDAEIADAEQDGDHWRDRRNSQWPGTLWLSACRLIWRVAP